MNTKIALATVSGRAYYRLVNELKRKDMSFLSLRPWDSIPLGIEVVITTKEERHLVTHPNVLVFDHESNPTAIIDETFLAIQGKRSYEKVVVGVDPGKTFGVAVLGDDNVLEARNCLSSQETANFVFDALNRIPALVKVVKVGNGAPAYTKDLLCSLNETLPNENVIEMVSEAGTSQLINETIYRRELKDAISAIEIARRKGQAFPRKK